jgi:hypothetical protein
MTLNLNWKGAVVMLLLEYFVLLRLYKRTKSLQVVSLIVAPLMVLVANVFAETPIRLFIVFALMELPLSLVGYKIVPDASILERIVVASAFGVSSSLIGKAI